MILPIAPAVAGTVCEIAEPTVRNDAREIIFSVVLACEAKTPAQNEKSVLVGMSLYMVKDGEVTAIEAHLNKSDTTSSTFSDDGSDWEISQTKRVLRKDKRVVIEDAEYDPKGVAPLDLPMHEIKLTAQPTKATLTFTVAAASAGTRNAFIIAVWPASQKQVCDAKDKSSRDGCKKFGFVIGDSAGIIGRTLAALDLQADRIAKVVVVDDGSTDATSHVVSRAASTCATHLVRLPDNRGKAAALNVGLAHACTDYVITLDADTKLEEGAIESALRMLMHERADAIAFWIDADSGAGFLARLQHHEYRLGMGFDRAGQSRAGIISVMPGAATLFRRSCLEHFMVSERTRTEDADLTLQMASAGHVLKLCRKARATTVPPRNMRALLRQRLRWTIGHIQCCRLHVPTKHSNAVFVWLTYPNFAVSTFFSFFAAIISLMLLSIDRTPLLSLDFGSVMVVSILLTYLQRVVAALLLTHHSGGGGIIFLCEPIVLGFVNFAAFLAAVGWTLKRVLVVNHDGEVGW